MEYLCQEQSLEICVGKGYLFPASTRRRRGVTPQGVTPGTGTNKKRKHALALNVRPRNRHAKLKLFRISDLQNPPEPGTRRGGKTLRRVTLPNNVRLYFYSHMCVYNWRRINSLQTTFKTVRLRLTEFVGRSFAIRE
jgi:hypothetical protein